MIKHQRFLYTIVKESLPQPITNFIKLLGYQVISEFLSRLNILHNTALNKSNPPVSAPNLKLDVMIQIWHSRRPKHEIGRGLQHFQIIRDPAAGSNKDLSASKSLEQPDLGSSKDFRHFQIQDRERTVALPAPIKDPLGEARI